jgi:hypothetical protein
MSSENADAPLNPEQLAEKARKKELHRKSMVWTGGMTVFSALAAAWVGFAPGRLLPSIGGSKVASPAVEAGPLGKTAVDWRPFSAQALAEARKLDRLVVLSVWARWSQPCRLMDGHAYADAGVANLLLRDFVATRVDADERPDLRLRYLGLGWPTTALLLPSGQVLDSQTYMTAPMFTRWAQTLLSRYKERREGVREASERALRAPPQAPGRDPRRALALARLALGSTWADGSALFPRFDRLVALARLRAPWAAPLAAVGRREALALEDAKRAGFFRDRRADGTFETEKLLGDQADALAALSEAEPQAAARLRDFVDKELADPAGGYASAVAFDGAPDPRLFCDENGRMAAAVLLDRGATAAQASAARKALDRFWAARREGLAPRRLGGTVYGLLGDQLGLLEGLLAAGRTADALALAGAAERALLDERGEAFYDRPAMKELPPSLDRIRVASLNARARRDWLALARAAGPDSSRGRALLARAGALGDWLWAHPEGLDAGDAAELAETRAPRDQ